MITPGQAGDSPMLLPLLAQLRVGRDIGRPRTRPDAVRGDKAYSSRAIRGHLRDRGITSVIPEPDDQKGHRKRRGSRGGRPVALDTNDLMTCSRNTEAALYSGQLSTIRNCGGAGWGSSRQLRGANDFAIERAGLFERVDRH